jgi:hypothetical protein
MRKLLAVLLVTVFSAVSFSAMAADPMSEAGAASVAPVKHVAHKHKHKHHAKKEVKKEEKKAEQAPAEIK